MNMNPARVKINLIYNMLHIMNLLFNLDFIFIYKATKKQRKNEQENKIK